MKRVIIYIMKVLKCLRCGKDVEVSLKCRKVFCPKCQVVVKRERCREYQRIDNSESKLRCSLCGKKLHYRNKTGLCIICSRPRGELHHSWKGGKQILPGGYVSVLVQPNDFFAPMRDSHGYVLEHRLVMAKELSRCLLPWEVVHHKNGVRDDSRIENLQLIADRRYHLVDAATKNHIKKLERRIKKLQDELSTQS